MLNFDYIDSNMTLVNLNIYYIFKSIKSPYEKYEFKISAPTWNYEIYLFDE